MLLLKPPDPKIPTRKYYVRIEEPLALTVERYAEFLGTERVEHVVAQALEFVFRKDTDFKEWTAQHPEPDPSRLTGCRKGRSPANATAPSRIARTDRSEEVSL